MSTNLCLQKVWGITVQAYCWWLNSGVLYPHWEVSFSSRNLPEPNEAIQDIRHFSGNDTRILTLLLGTIDISRCT